MREESVLTKEKFNSINILLKDEYLLAHIDTAVLGVVIPEELYVKRSVTLRLSRFFKGYIKVSEEKIVSELVFGEERFNCLIPLKAVWGLTSLRGTNIVWPESAPPGLINLMQEAGDLIKLGGEATEKKSEIASILKDIEGLKNDHISSKSIEQALKTRIDKRSKSVKLTEVKKQNITEGEDKLTDSVIKQELVSEKTITEDLQGESEEEKGKISGKLPKRPHLKRIK